MLGDSWPNKEGKARWAEGQDGQSDGAGRRDKRRADDCRAGHNGGNDGWVKWEKGWGLRGVTRGSVLGY